MPSRAALAYRAGAAAARALPRPLAELSAGALGVAATAVARGRRRQVERNVRRVLGPGASRVQVQRAVRRTFQSYARYWVESFRLPGTSAEDLAARMTIDGWEHVDAGLAAGKGVIFALPHLGGWEWAGFWVAVVQKEPITVVVERLEPPDLFDWFVDLRRSFGMNVVPLGPSAGSEVMAALRDNHIVCLVCDRDIGGSGVEVEFFGEPTTLPAGPATLALRTEAALLPVAVYDRGGTHHGVVRPPLATDRTGRLRDDVNRVTQALTSELEGLIRAAPEQWHLLQPNWPSDPGWDGDAS
ncbi:MAG: phosphatidylinositol mannoside acyltransferase [Acidimicrobiales bacterium]